MDIHTYENLHDWKMSDSQIWYRKELEEAWKEWGEFIERLKK